MLIVRDTRESGEMLEAALAAGVSSAGGHALLGGVLPTPGAALLVRRYGFDLAAVVSASHNPYEDNGIKFFGPEGTKLADVQEEQIERLVHEHRPSDAIGRVRDLHGARRRLRARARDALRGPRPLRASRSCSTAPTARPTGSRRRSSGGSGAEPELIAVDPDGRNINRDCGSTHVGQLAERVTEGGFDIGFALDGDGDRVLAVDRRGAVVDGDELMALAALHLRENGRLPGDGVAVTVMTNYGFHQAMEVAGIEVATTQVGDRHVLAELLSRGWAFGGEQSGHIIDTGFVPAGDGTAAALLTLEALAGRDLSERDAMEKLPQRLVNVRVRDRDALEHAADVREAVEQEHKALEGRGRVLVRPSGTEPLVRVMVEAPTADECNAVCDRLVSLVERRLGS